jgi:hypothetical protein
VIPRPVEHGGDEETADVAREKGPPPGAMLASDMEFDVSLVDGGKQPAAPRPASPMVEFLKTMAKKSFACREELAIKGVKPNTDIPSQYTHTTNWSVLEMV